MPRTLHKRMIAMTVAACTAAAGALVGPATTAAQAEVTPGCEWTGTASMEAKYDSSDSTYQTSSHSVERLSYELPEGASADCEASWSHFYYKSDLDLDSPDRCGNSSYSSWLYEGDGGGQGTAPSTGVVPANDGTGWGQFYGYGDYLPIKRTIENQDGCNGGEITTTVDQDARGSTLIIAPTGDYCTEPLHTVTADVQSFSGSCTLDASSGDTTDTTTWTWNFRRSVCDDTVDSDGGGISDCEEFIAGTNASDPADDDEDVDNDGVTNKSDNCPTTANGNQADLDGDGQGDVCDADDDGDGLSDTEEPGLGTDPRNPDTDGDTVKDGTDQCKTVFGSPDSLGCPEELQAAIDWTMPEQMKDADGNGAPDSYLRNGEQTAVVPSDGRYPVTLNGCGSDGTITSYSWIVDGGSPLTGSACSRTLTLTEGSHDVLLTVFGAAGGQSSKHVTIKVKNLLVLGLGDSYGSGEGNPHDSAGGGKWDHNPCHRSVWSGQARAAMAMEKRDPRTSVTFVHLACSGATVNRGILGTYSDPPGDAKTDQPKSQKPQVVRARQLANGQPYDAIILSIGGNDIGFGDMVTTCLKKENCPLVPVSGRVLHKRTQDKLAKMADKYQSVGRCLSIKEQGCRLASGTAATSLGVKPASIFVTEYPDPTRDDDGETCQAMLQSPLFSGIWWNESEWIRDVVLEADGLDSYRFWKTNSNGVGIDRVRLEVNEDGLNPAIASAAARAGWQYVSGISYEFRRHGMCADDHWVRRLKESLAIQQDEKGTAHPNVAGHRPYSRNISPLMISRFGLPVPGPTLAG